MKLTTLCQLAATAFLFLALLLSRPALGEAEERYILATGGSAVLTDASGVILIEAGRYGDMIALGGGGLYAATPLGATKWGLIDEEGQALTAFDLDTVRWDGEDVAFSRAGLWGVMGAAGQTLIEPRYTLMIRAGSGSYLAFKTDPFDDLPDVIYHVSLDGSETSTGVQTAAGLQAASGGYVAYIDTLGQYGYLNESGEAAIAPAFTYAGAFIAGCAVAATGEGFGLIDAGGNWIAGPGYSLVARSECPGAPALAAGKDFIELIDAPSGRSIARLEGEDISAAFSDEAVIVTYGDGTRALYDFEGRELFARTDGVAWMSARAGYIILARRQPSDAPYQIVTPDGETFGAWQGLTRAGQYKDETYFIAMSCDTREAACDAYGLTLYDEVEGTRRYSLVNGRGAVVSAGYTSLSLVGPSLIRAETDSWIGLIRPDGEVIMKLEKEE